MINLLDRSFPVDKRISKKLTPELALERLKQGNKKFYDLKRNKSKPLKRNINDFVKNGSEGQHPFAMVLSCVDSRIPTEEVFDQYIGDIFNARIAGNFVNEDILGSMEFSASYVKLIVVLGHTACGAVGAACNTVYPLPKKNKAKESEEEKIPSNLAQLVGKLMPAVAATPVDIDEIKNAGRNSLIRKKFINKAAETNVRQTIGDILVQSDFLRKKILDREIFIKGAIYDVETGKVTFIQ